MKMVDPSRLTDPEKDLLALCINNFGGSEHPMADRTCIGHFVFEYALKCVQWPIDNFPQDERIPAVRELLTKLEEQQ